jgi:hypothetical protein
MARIAEKLSQPSEDFPLPPPIPTSWHLNSHTTQDFEAEFTQKLVRTAALYRAGQPLTTPDAEFNSLAFHRPISEQERQWLAGFIDAGMSISMVRRHTVDRSHPALVYRESRYLRRPIALSRYSGKLYRMVVSNGFGPDALDMLEWQGLHDTAVSTVDVAQNYLLLKSWHGHFVSLWGVCPDTAYRNQLTETFRTALTRQDFDHYDDSLSISDSYLAGYFDSSGTVVNTEHGLAISISSRSRKLIDVLRGGYAGDVTKKVHTIHTKYTGETFQRKRNSYSWHSGGKRGYRFLERIAPYSWVQRDLIEDILTVA